MGKIFFLFQLPFKETQSRDEYGQFTVPLKMNFDGTTLGETRSLAVKRFESLEHSLRVKGRFEEFTDAPKEYTNMDNAEPVRT